VAAAAPEVARTIVGPALVRQRPRPAQPKEVATEFIPLVHDPFWAPGESAQLLRVRMPRSSLAGFGLPLNEERVTETVRADVIVGQDGIVRAIRFVQ
jgi:hypothetical protein